VIGIYKITNKINGKCYVGQSTNIQQRWKDHKKDAFWKNGPDYEYPLYRAIRKYGFENFLFEIIEECEIECLNEKEMFYIAKYRSYTDGYNQNEGGYNGVHNCKLSYDDVTKIIQRLKTTLDSTKTIAMDFGVGFTTIRNINVGESYRRDNESYPIRPYVGSLYIDETGQYRLKNSSTRRKDCQGHMIREKNHICELCGDPVWKKGSLCKSCSTNLSRKATRPSKNELAKMIVESSFVQVGKHFGVDGNTIKKWCKSYDIPHRKKELVDWYNQQFNTLSEDVVQKSTYNAKKPVNQIEIETGKVLATFESIGAAGNALNNAIAYKKLAKFAEVFANQHTDITGNMQIKIQ
jgi:group I intron endonuclease